jgi:translation initiation factor IF-2
MSNEPEPGVIGSLPRSRPHRRSDKRPAPAGAKPAPTKPKPATAKPKAAGAKPRAAGAKPKPAAPKPVPPAPHDPSPGPLETAVQAAAELAEIGLHAGARALRRAVARLPRP